MARDLEAILDLAVAQAAIKHYQELLPQVLLQSQLVVVALLGQVLWDHKAQAAVLTAKHLLVVAVAH